jgi:DNA polymerase II small subunit
MSVQEIIAQLFEHDILITPEQAKLLTERDAHVIAQLLKKPAEVESYLQRLSSRPTIKVAAKEVKTNDTTSSVEVLRHYNKKPKKRSFNDFVQYFNVRYQTMEKMLRSRKELNSVMSIERCKQYARGGQQQATIIGLVSDKRETKNGHIILELEDRSGRLNVLVSLNKSELHALAQDVSLDEIVGVIGNLREDIVFADSLLIPGVPATNELKKSPDQAYAVVISDLHLGNKNFFADNFSLFLDWLAGKHGSKKMRDMARKTKYVFITGDLIEGVGVYPSQEKDLSIPDIFEQYKLCDEWLDRIPHDKHIVIIPGNHDIGRLSEPQPALGKELLPKLSSRENVHLLSNPSTVRFHASNDFPGFTCLLYHGGSFIYYGNNVMRLFFEGGMSNPCGVMQYLLNRRHLAPSHTATLYVPDNEEDPLIINEVPDFFLSGHLHTTQDKTWNGITMISASCWVPLTEYQIKAGLKIDPGKFIIIDLKTRAVEAIKPEEL